MQYWLMKSEPDVYSIDDLARETKPALWEGCRNFTVRNFLKNDMQAGDLAFFYHSSTKPPGVVGIMEIVGDAFGDPTQFDPESEYYDAKSKPEKPIWIARNVRLVEKFSRIVTLEELKSTAGLEKMLVVRKGQRLSVMPVTPQEWQIVIEMAGKTA
jgi:predicted RNA-binding protein with PUA-like domain